MLKQFLIIIGAVMVIEGLPYLAAPGSMKRIMAEIMTVPDSWLRFFGVLAIVIGLTVVWSAGIMD